MNNLQQNESTQKQVSPKNVQFLNTLSSNVSKEAFNIKEQQSQTKGEKISIFDNYAGFDGKGGYHGSGGHGGNQINLFPQSQKQQNNQIYQFDAAHNQDKFMNLNQIHPNREQRAVNIMMPQKHSTIGAQQSGQSSPKIHKLDFLNQKEIIQNKFAPSMKDMIIQKNIQSATNSDENSKSPFMLPKNNNIQYLFENSQNSLTAAGYDNYGPQMLSQEQLFKIRQGQSDFAKKIKALNLNTDQKSNQKSHNAQQTHRSQNQNNLLQSIFPKIDESNKNQEKNVFNQVDLPQKFISDKANYLLTGDKNLKLKPFNINNQSLLPKEKQNDININQISIKQLIKEPFLARQSEIKNHKRKESYDYLQNTNENLQTIKYPPLFKQQPFWKNTEQKSQFTKQIENNGQIYNKHYLDFNSFSSLQYNPETRAVSNIFRRQLNDDLKKNESLFEKINESKNFTIENQNTMNSLDAIRIPLDVQILQNTGSKLQIFDEKSIQDDRYFQYNIDKIEETLKNKKLEYQALKQKIQVGGDIRDQQKLVDIANQINFQRKQIFLIQSQYLGSESKIDKTKLNIESSRNHKVGSKFDKTNESAFRNQNDLEDSIYSSAQKKFSSSLKQSVMPQSHRINSQNARTNQSSFNLQSTLDVKKEFSSLHIYDSLLLSKKVEEMVLKEKFLSKQKKQYQSFSVNQRGSTTALNLQTNIKIQNDFDQQKIRKEQIDDKTEYSSSAQSNFQTIKLGEQKIQTLKGTNITQLSPITRQMNQMTLATLTQLEKTFIKKSNAEKNKKEKDNQEMSKEYKQKLDENQKAIKIMKYQLINLVAPESEKYQLIMPNNEYNNVEVLPEMIPVYLKVPCSLLKSPCFFEVLMNDVEVMHVLMSTHHKFPKEENQLFEYEKLIMQDKVKEFLDSKQSNQTVQIEDKKKNVVKKTSIVMMEIFSKLKNRAELQIEEKKQVQEVSLKKRKIEEMEKLMLTKQTFKFVKQNFQENFDEGDQIYIAIISQTGGSIRIRASCISYPDTKEEIPAKKSENDKQNSNQISQEDLINELKEWFDQNVHMLNYYINQNALNFLQLNKSDRLQQFYYKNQASIHQNRIIQNQQKREKALEKAESLTIQKYEKNKQNLQKWDNYRETKIEMTAIFIKILKRKNFTRRWLIIHKYIQIYSKIVENLFIRRDLNHILFTSIHTAIRFKISYLYRYRKQFGFQMEKRNKNEIRRSLNFGAVAKYNTIIDDVKCRLSNFIFKTFLVFNTCQKFTYFNDSLLYIQQRRRELQKLRDSQWIVLYKKLLILKDCLVQFYAKKKSKKHGQKLIKALKKVFGQGRNEDYKMVKKVAYEFWGKKNMLETQNLQDSIKIRSLIVQSQLMGKCTLKDEEGNKIYKNQIEELKLQVESILKKVRKQTKDIEKVERDLWSWPDKEIKDLQKKAKFRKPDPKDVELAEIHKFDTAKIMKDDKLLKYCKTQYSKLIKPKKSSPGKKDNKAKNKGSPDQQNQDGEDQAMEGDGQEGAEMEGDEMEGEEGENKDEKGDEANEDDAAEDKEDGGAKQDEEPVEAEAEEAQGSDQENNKDEMQDQQEDQKDQADGEQSARKKATRSVSKSKVIKKKVDEEIVAIIAQKPNPKIKGKFMIDEKITNPQEIIDYVNEEYPDIESQEQSEFQGFNIITPQQLQEVIVKMYYKVEKQKLIKMTKSQKIKNDFTTMIRIILHLGLNIGPQQQLNEDIEININENEQNPQFAQTVFELTAANQQVSEDQAAKKKGKKKNKTTDEASEEKKTPISPKSKENEKECSKEAKKALTKINFSNHNQSQDDHKTIMNEQIPTNQSIGQIHDGINTFLE